MSENIKYLLFAGDVYYPLRGVFDLKGSFDSPEEAEEFYYRGYELVDGITSSYEWGQIVNHRTMEIVRTIA